jgi:hypothetical protein
VKLPQLSLAKVMAMVVVIAVGLIALRNTSVAGPSRWSRIPFSEDAAFKRDVWKSQMWASATFILTVSTTTLAVNTTFQDSNDLRREEHLDRLLETA